MIQQETFQFLADLKNNNNREWFLANKKRYEAYKKNYHDFVAAIIKELSSFDPGISQLDIKDCTFRINRDIRFSKDKSPYKTHMGVWLSTDKSCKNAPGYYIHFDTEKPFIAAGLYCPESTELKKVRREIAFFHEDLDTILKNKEFRKEFNSLDSTPETLLKTAPKGFEKDHPAVEYLRFKSYTVTHYLNKDFFFKPEITALISSKFKTAKPFINFLNRALETEE